MKRGAVWHTAPRWQEPHCTRANSCKGMIRPGFSVFQLTGEDKREEDRLTFEREELSIAAKHRDDREP